MTHKTINLRIPVAYSDETGLWAAVAQSGYSDGETDEWCRQVVGFDDRPRIVAVVTATNEVPAIARVAGQRALFD